MRLLIAEDDPKLLSALIKIFQANNYSTDAVDNGIDALYYAQSGNYDGIVLDVMMPGKDGIEVLKELRENFITTPVIILTAKNEVSDRITGLDSGADDYLAKPFAIGELLARVRAMLRRKDDFTPELKKYNGLSLNCSTMEIEYNGKTSKLVNREFQMLQMLIETPRCIITTDRFMEHIWGWESGVEVSIVWVIISNLRKKMTEINAPVEIRAARGVGYSLEAKND